MRRVVLITFTPKDWSGGVNRWVRDFMGGYENSVHFSAADIPGWRPGMCHEWDAAKALNTYLRVSKKISKEDVIIVDGFWGLGLEDFPRVVSVAHGIWSHLTLEDVEQGKPLDNPVHHAIQVEYRKKHLERGGKIVAVSDFISTEMRRQWGFTSKVINNAIDLEAFKPVQKNHQGKLVIHGVNDPGNENKGWKHIKHLKENLDCSILSLDEAHAQLGRATKAETLAEADLVVIPSAYEGNSYFCLETLACDVPVVAYNVGLMYRAWGDKAIMDLGVILDRQQRSPEYTCKAVKEFLDNPHSVAPRKWVSKYSVQNFQTEWREYVGREFP